MMISPTLLGSSFFEKQQFSAGFPNNLEDSDRWQYLADCYERWKDTCAANIFAATIIPKRIHQIWLGSPLPEKYRPFCDSWSLHNPDYEYKLWGEKEILEFLTDRIAELYNKTDNYGAKSDIARYAILHQFGGLYADTDFECVQPVAELLESTSFCAGLTVDTTPQIMNSLIACTPKHPVIIHALDGIKAPVAGHKGRSILESTGPFFFTEAFFTSREHHLGDETILPTPYFYAFPSVDRYKRFTDSREIKANYLAKDSLAIHYWEVSWQKKDPRLLRILKTVIRKVIPVRQIKRILTQVFHT